MVAEFDCIGLCSGSSKGGRRLEIKGKRCRCVTTNDLRASQTELEGITNHPSPFFLPQLFCLRLAALNPIFRAM
jgi:hypothetical protein